MSLIAQGWAVPAWAEDLGTWISIGFLTALGLVNLRGVWLTPAGEVVQPVGLKARWLAGLQRASHPVLIAAVGAMFALSFDTLSQAALFAATGANQGGVGHALALGLLFTVGMLVADGINGLWVARLLRRADAAAALASRMLALTVGSLALAVAAWGLARHLWPAVAGWGEGKELAIGLAVVGAIALGYCWFELGSHSPKTFLQQDLVILSPGVSPILKIFEYARSQGIKITGEFEFAQGFIKESMVGVTGTNGKTTVARLAEAMLKNSGITCWVGGSNERPLTDYLRFNEKTKVVIIEVSAFMLEHTESFNPSNIVFTNLAENHLDRYRSMEEYINAKRRVFRNTNQMTTSILMRMTMPLLNWHVTQQFSEERFSTSLVSKH